jgi:hypothetical protein
LKAAKAQRERVLEANKGMAPYTVAKPGPKTDVGAYIWQAIVLDRNPGLEQASNDKAVTDVWRLRSSEGPTRIVYLMKVTGGTKIMWDKVAPISIASITKAEFEKAIEYAEELFEEADVKSGIAQDFPQFA